MVGVNACWHFCYNDYTLKPTYSFRYQDIFLDNMRIGSNIARNKALKENIFMMVVCIELRIPLFVVGKPGSSKSLAKTIVHDSMAGQASDSKLMKDLKQVPHSFLYVC